PIAEGSSSVTVDRPPVSSVAVGVAVADRQAPCLAKLLGQSLLEILDQILSRLQADRQSNQVVGDAEAAALIGSHAGVRGNGGPDDERLRTAWAGGASRQPQTGNETVGARHVARQLEAQHATEAIEQAARPRMSGMAGQPRMVDARHRAVPLEEAG